MSYQVSRDNAIGYAIQGLLALEGRHPVEVIEAQALYAQAWLAVAETLKDGPFVFTVAPCICSEGNNPNCPKHREGKDG